MSDSADGSAVRSKSTTGAHRGGVWRRLRGMFGVGETPMPDLDPSDPTLVVVAESDDEAAAASSVLAASQWRGEEAAVLRHIVQVPETALAAIVEIAGIDGYRRADLPAVGIFGDVHAGPGDVVLALARAQQVTAVGLSQERSRMASLGSRHRGQVYGWQVLQRPLAADV